MATQAFTLVGPPAIALALSGWLRDARLPRWLDTLIALLVILLTALLWALFAGKLAGDLVVDTVIIAAYTAALIAGPMASLHQWLTVAIPSPFSAIMAATSPFVPALEPVVTMTPPATIAPRIALPTTPALIARNSLLSPGVTASPPLQQWVTTTIPEPLPALAPTPAELVANGVTATTLPATPTQTPTVSQGTLPQP